VHDISYHQYPITCGSGLKFGHHCAV